MNNYWHSVASKEEIGAKIALMLEAKPVPFSSGSTEPRALFVLTAELLGIPFSPRDTKISIAKKIVESGGELWKPEFESTGSTVTRTGLLAVLDAVCLLTGKSL